MPKNSRNGKINEVVRVDQTIDRHTYRQANRHRSNHFMKTNFFHFKTFTIQIVMTNEMKVWFNL